MQLRKQKYLNNIVEQDPRFIKKHVRSMLGFKCFDSATCKVVINLFNYMVLNKHNPVLKLERG